MLQAGSHPVRIYLLKKTAREQDFEIQWHAPGASMAKMSAADFFHE